MFAFIMVQILKDNIRDSIIDAALHEFAKHGFSDASIASIAKRAGISTGNVYRYFNSKTKLFENVVPSSFVRMLLRKFQQRMGGYPIGTRLEELPEHSLYLTLSEELLVFSIENRLRVLIVFEGSSGTAYEAFIPNLRAELTQKAIKALRLTKLTDNSDLVSTLLEDLYGNYLRTLGSILRQFSQETDIRAAVRIVSTYHLGGLAMIAQ